MDGLVESTTRGAVMRNHPDERGEDEQPERHSSSPGKGQNVAHPQEGGREADIEPAPQKLAERASER
jgi:hypothetical protein